MHELSYVYRLEEQAINYLKDNPLKKGESVEALLVDVGDITGVIPEWLSRYYDQTIVGTVLEGSGLEITQIHVTINCQDCNEIYAPSKDNGYICPFCGSKRGKIVSGREFFLRSMIIRDTKDDPGE